MDKKISKKFNKFYPLALIVVFLVSLNSVLAQEGLPNPLGTTDVPTLIGRIINAVLGVIGSIALLMFLYGGLTWLTAAGNDQKIQKGKAILTWAVVGLAIIFSSYILVNFVIKGLTGGES